MVPMLAQAGDFLISMDRKKDGTGQVAKSGIELQTSQQWVGEIKVENLAFKPTAEIELRYILFVKRQDVKQNAEMDQMEQVKGTIKVGSLKGREKGTFLTSEVTLFQQQIKANWVYVDKSGKEIGKRKAEDAVMGVWVKLFSGEAELADYANPSTLKQKNKWE